MTRRRLPGAGTLALGALVDRPPCSPPLYLLMQDRSRTMRSEARGAQAEARELTAHASPTAEALIKAEPQVLMYWEHGKGLSVVTNTLTGVPGLPGEPAGARALRLLARPEVGGQPQAGARPAVLGRARLQHHPQDGGRRPRRSRRTRRRRPRRAATCATSPATSATCSPILDQHTRLARDVRSSRALLNALPHPVWLRDQDGRLSWVNSAYVKAVDAESEARCSKGQIELLESRQRKSVAARAEDRADRSPSACRSSSAASANRTRSSRCRSATPPPARPSTSPPSKPPRASSIARSPPTTARSTAWRRRLPSSAPSRSSPSSTRPIRSSGSSTPAGSIRRPSDGAVLDRLRELGRLPEVVNYREWKDKILKVLQGRAPSTRTGGTFPTAASLHVMAAQRPDGGVTYLYADETERLALESRYNALISVQRETLDSLKEGVAVFAHRRTPAAVQLAPSPPSGSSSRRQLAENPHIDEFIRDARVLYDDTATWAHIGHAVTSFSDAARAARRPDGAPRQQRHRLRGDAAAGRRHAAHLRRRHLLEALRARPRRAQRGPRHRRPAQEPVHRPRVL